MGKGPCQCRTSLAAATSNEWDMNWKESSLFHRFFKEHAGGLETVERAGAPRPESGRALFEV